MNKWRYFSKHREGWCDFTEPPGSVELRIMNVYKYRLELNGEELSGSELMNEIIKMEMK